MKVLSLFDGIACGRVALERIGIDVERYVAYEIENSAIQIAKHNYPDIEERGDVFKADFTEFGGFDLLIGGSPCTWWSISKAGHGRETTSSGLGWDLFQQYIRAWKESGVKYYLYENNASMSKEIRMAISDAFGHEPLEINSALVSAQTRKRLYWTNIPDACVPEDRGITLSSIIESGFVDRAKSLCLARRYAGFQGSLSYLCRRYFGKSMGQAVFEDVPPHSGLQRQACYESLKALYKANDRFTDDEARRTECIIRPMTIKECERLQTLPDGYTEKVGCSRTQCIEAIGNGWTVDVICHLMSGLKSGKEPVKYAEQCTMEFPEHSPKPGVVYWNGDMTMRGALTQSDLDKLPKKCYLCGTPLDSVEYIDAVARHKEQNPESNDDEELVPICPECVKDRKIATSFKDMMRIAGVTTVIDLVKWISDNTKYLCTKQWYRKGN